MIKYKIKINIVDDTIYYMPCVKRVVWTDMVDALFNKYKCDAETNKNGTESIEKALNIIKQDLPICEKCGCVNMRHWTKNKNNKK